MRPVTIVLYGATGYTGRLVASELARRGLDHVLSGRDEGKLAQLAEERKVPVRAAPLDPAGRPGLGARSRRWCSPTTSRASA